MASAPIPPWNWPCIIALAAYPSLDLPTISAEEAKKGMSTIARIDIKNAIRSLFNGFGYDLRRLSRASGGIRTTIGESYSLIRGLGFQPKTVLDVGVASGTAELYSAFPEAYFLLIEPLKECEPDLISILKRYKGSYVLAAAGASAGQATFKVHQDLVGSSLYEETMGAEAGEHAVTVPVIRIDDILKERRLDGPYLIKVDVQGAELEALEGARQALSEAEVVVLEASFDKANKRPQGTVLFIDRPNHGLGGPAHEGSRPYRGESLNGLVSQGV